MIAIQERDQFILQTIYNHRFLPIEDVERYIFKGVHPKRAWERIVELERAGYLQREQRPPLRRSILRLTKAGEARVVHEGTFHVGGSRRLDPLTLLHDRLVIATSFRLREFWEATWVPERALKQEEYPQIPDGVLVFKEGSQVAVEIENSPKGPKRFHDLQERWRQVPVLLILYIASSPNLFSAIQRYLKTGPQDLPFGLLLWRDLEMGQPKIWTIRGEVDLLAQRIL